MKKDAREFMLKLVKKYMKDNKDTLDEMCNDKPEPERQHISNQVKCINIRTESLDWLLLHFFNYTTLNSYIIARGDKGINAYEIYQVGRTFIKVSHKGRIDFESPLSYEFVKQVKKRVVVYTYE